MPDLVFLKLGGSLITDKKRAHTPRPDVISRVAEEIALARRETPELRLLLGHGSGSFGHVAAHKHHTREGVQGQASWLGFAEVWSEARALNQIIIEGLSAAGLPVVAFPPSAFMLSRDGIPAEWPIEGLERALGAGLVPVVNGDVVFDTVRGGTILSTEDVFSALAFALSPRRILLAGIEAGVYADFPACLRPIEQITSASFAHVLQGISGSASVDVTGGMRQKVELMLHLTHQIPGLEALIFSGDIPGNVQNALAGRATGTRITD
jgi:isopentenyl phosphate kinase